MDKTWTDEDVNLLKQCYSEENGVRKAYELLKNRTKLSIRNKAYSLGIKNLNYTKDENFFETPNTLNSSVAGAIATDGHLESKQRQIGISHSISIYQKSLDEEWLRQILAATKSNYKILSRSRRDVSIFGRETKSYDSQSCLIFSKAGKWIKDIQTHWAIPTGSKSYTLPAPNNLGCLDNELAYISGMIDGDGSITINNHQLRLTLLGTKPLLDWCRNVICEFLGKEVEASVLKEHPGRADNSLYILIIGGYSAILLFEKLKSLNTIKLKRKWDNPLISELINKKKKCPLYAIKGIKRFENLPDYRSA